VSFQTTELGLQPDVGAVFAAAAAAIGGAQLRPKTIVVPDAEAVDEVAVPVH
jgi:hypothetical protein